MPTNTEKKTGWRIRKRMCLLKSSCIGLLFGFFLAYLGGINDNDFIVIISFVVFGIAVFLPVIAKR
jgi:hypothetical protein